MKQGTAGALAIVFAAVLWGVDGVLLTPRLAHHIDVFVIVLLFHAVAFVFMAIPFYLGRSELKKLRPRDYFTFVWIALLGGALGTIAFVAALHEVNFEMLSVVVLLQKLQPFFAISLAWLMLGERPRSRFFMYAVLAIVGSYMITFGFHAPVISGNKIAYAALLSIFAAFAWGSSTAFGKKAVGLVSFHMATYLRFGLTALIMLIIVAGLNRFSGIASITGTDWLIFLLIALTTGGGAIFIYYYGMKRTTASRAAIYELAMPVTVVLLDILVNHAKLSVGQWIGAALLVFSMLMVTRK